jgi:hypothetical protein
MNLEKLDAVYLVTEETNEVSHSIAIRPTLCDNYRVIWEDTGRGRIVDYRKKTDLVIDIKDFSTQYSVPKKIDIYPERFVHYSLEYLTVDLYNKFIKDIVAKSPVFASTEELQDFYLHHSFR